MNRGKPISLANCHSFQVGCNKQYHSWELPCHRSYDISSPTWSLTITQTPALSPWRPPSTFYLIYPRPSCRQLPLSQCWCRPLLLQWQWMLMLLQEGKSSFDYNILRADAIISYIPNIPHQHGRLLHHFHFLQIITTHIPEDLLQLPHPINNLLISLPHAFHTAIVLLHKKIVWKTNSSLCPQHTHTLD